MPALSAEAQLFGHAAMRYSKKLFNSEFLRSKGIPVPDWLDHAFSTRQHATRHEGSGRQIIETPASQGGWLPLWARGINHVHP